MTDGNTCTCRGYAAMHKPHPHADRDGSESRAQLEREHERALAAYVPEDEADEVARELAELREFRRAVMDDHFGYDPDNPEDVAEVLTYMPVWKGEEAARRERLEEDEAALARVEALAAQWEVGYNSPIASSWAKVHADLLRAALAEPEAEAAS